MSETSKNLVQQSCGYVFRMVIPSDLRPIIGKTELRYSLNECSLLYAKRKSKAISAKVKDVFSELRAELRDKQREGNSVNQMNRTKINRIISDMIKATIADMETEKAVGQPITRGQLDDHLNELDLLEHDYRESLSLRDYRLIHPVVDFLIEEGKLGIEKDTPDYFRFAAEVLKAHIHLLQVDRQQSTGDYSYRNTQWNGVNVEPEPELNSETVGKVVSEYWSEKVASWKPRTVPEYERFRDTLLKFLGKTTAIKTISYDIGRSYKAHLDTLKTPKGNPLSDARKDIYLGFAKQLFRWAVQHNYININPFDGLQVGKSGRKRADEQRASFSRDDLQLIFVKSKEYRTDKITRPDYFWVPLLTLFTGCRLEELCQAYVKDIKKEEGVWVLDINDEGDKEVKIGGRRLVPIHDTLIDLGFLNYVQKQPQKGRLFPKFLRVSPTCNLRSWTA